MKTPLFLTMGAAVCLAADPAGFHMYRKADLQAKEKQLIPKLNEHKVASETLDRFSTNRTMLAHREGPGVGELHETDADYFVVQSGEATLIVGGVLEKQTKESPGELRGPSIKGGTQKKLTPGDIVHIPAKVPHQLLIDNGKTFTYFVIKVKE